jgi:N-6 DNA Methylase
VEQIGSVYEAIMGYTVELAGSNAIGVNSKPKGSKHSTTVVVDLDRLLHAKGADRVKILKDEANCELPAKALKLFKEAKTETEMMAALDRKVSRRTPNILRRGSLYLQPTAERRKSGSHYTPRQLTQPIVEKALEPVFARLGANPTADQILDLKICDLAMGSGAFLVEACRQLAEKLVTAWDRRGETPSEGGEPLLLARRIIAQRCLYGVDKNPFAVNLAKLSLWLVTLAKDYPFTFLDHALKCGDSLVGLTRAEIGSFAKDPKGNMPLFQYGKEELERVKDYRFQIQSFDTRTDEDTERKALQLRQAERELTSARLTGDIMVSAFFEGKNSKERTTKHQEYANTISMFDVHHLEDVSHRLRDGNKPIIPFSWEIEFPEVFDRDNGGFDCIVGNPPFVGGKKISTNYGDEYLAWIVEQHPESKGNADLVAHFFRRGFTLLRDGGTFGLIATNTIAQGDTRASGLRYICNHGGTIYHARKRMKWPGLAAVVVSVVHGITKPTVSLENSLDGKPVPKITAFLFHDGGNDDPKPLIANAGKSFIGSYVLGMGFTFDDTNPDATSIEEMHRLIAQDPRNQERIFPYIGGEEVNSSPTHDHHRYVINFFDISEEEAWKYPDLMQIVKDKVKPERDRQKRDALRLRWWQYADKRPALVKTIAPLDRVLGCSQTSKHLSFTFLPANMVFSHKIVIFPFEKFSPFTVIQSRSHEIWTTFFGSSMKDDPVYTPSDCFETFPFPEEWETNTELEEIGREYYQYRARLMIENNQGLTATYNRFHDPDETDEDILYLRELHEKMDRAVLKAYGWTDIPTDCQFLLDYEEEEEETSSKRKKPYRYRWPEEVHDEVLARLLVLNQTRHDEEVMLGKVGGKKGKKTK